MATTKSRKGIYRDRVVTVLEEGMKYKEADSYKAIGRVLGDNSFYAKASRWVRSEELNPISMKSLQQLVQIHPTFKSVAEITSYLHGTTENVCP